MTKETSRIEVKKAFEIGITCIFVYLMSYYMRNLLSVTTPDLLASGLYTKEAVAALSSTYMIVYAAGQLINGLLGDLIPSRYMALAGYCLAAPAMLIFSFDPPMAVSLVAFGMLGLGFSMLRGPLVKTISENTLPKYAKLICAFFSFSCLFGPVIASELSLFLRWNRLFRVSAIAAIVTGLAAFTVLTLLEKKNYITVKKAEVKTGLSPKTLLSVFTIPGFNVYLIIGMVVEISATSITFWIPTYINEHLMLSEAASKMIFSGITVFKSLAPFAALTLYSKLFRERDDVMMRVMFFLASLMYVGMFFTKSAVPNLIFFLLALVFTGCASSVMWSIYVPSLGKTGKVSSANGVLDCSGYVGASLANIGFAAAMEKFGWKGIIVIWGCIMLAGSLITLAATRSRRKEAETAAKKN